MIFKLNYKITKLGKTDKYKYSKEDTAYSRGEWRQHVHKEDNERRGHRWDAADTDD